MQHSEIDPPLTLRNQIRGFWYRQMDLGDTSAAFEVLPDGNAEIIFHIGSGCSVIIDEGKQQLPSPFVVGLLKRPVYFECKGIVHFIGIKCVPWAVYDLLNITCIKGGVHSITHPIAQLQAGLEELVGQAKVTEALELLGEWFLEHCTPEDQARMLAKAGTLLLDAKGTLPVSAVADGAHMTVRTLERKFKASSGHTVKDVSGLIRFEQARDRLWEDPDSSITGLAHELGYADQSHLNREFKRYCGLTAAAFARQMKSRKNDLGNDFVAIILSS